MGAALGGSTRPIKYSLSAIISARRGGVFPKLPRRTAACKRLQHPLCVRKRLRVLEDAAGWGLLAGGCWLGAAGWGLLAGGCWLGAAGWGLRHPRACGEEETPLRFRVLRRGSSPRLRGRVMAVCLVGVIGGVIPAPAGKSHLQLRPRRLDEGHPRACGEEPVAGDRWRCRCGSSPRLRGRGIPACRRMRRPRVIPAPAGKSGSPRRWRLYMAGHPRACGEEFHA